MIRPRAHWIGVTALGLCFLITAGATAKKRSIIPPGAALTRVATGAEFAEGPAADAQGNVYFSDSPANRIWVYTASGKLHVFTDRSRNANGMMFDARGRLVTCNAQGKGGGRSVTLYQKNGKVTVLADRYRGKRLNSPNDLCIDRRGRIYFTDPRYGEGDDLEQDKMAVYRLEKNGALTRVIDDLEVPNGILISRDNKTLYVADNSPRDGGPRTLVAYAVSRKGEVKRRGVVFDLAPERGIDGMAMDTRGNIYAAAGSGKKSGVYLISPKGKQLGFIPTPETATNCTFGGKKLDTLYITDDKSLYRIRLNATGQLVYPPLPKPPRRRSGY